MNYAEFGPNVDLNNGKIFTYPVQLDAVCSYLLVFTPLMSDYTLENKLLENAAVKDEA